jgi:hypothetical protein
MTDEEAVILYRDKISVFVKTHARKPNINSTDLLERRMAEACISAVTDVYKNIISAMVGKSIRQGRFILRRTDWDRLALQRIDLLAESQ